MQLEGYVETLQRQLTAAAAASGPDIAAAAERLTSALEPALRLTLLDALAAAADEITRELAPGSVALRLRGRDPEFVLTPAQEPADDVATEPTAAGTGVGGDGGVSRINLRLPEQLKAHVERAAEREGLSVNSWLVRAVALAVGRDAGGPRRAARPPHHGGDRYVGWAR